MLKFSFSVKTRDGQKVDGILIMGNDQPDAERKLMQMYRHCTVLHCDIKNSDDKQHATSMEDILSMISKEE